ncbi:hypothetical protein RHMOL_Rhmol10G0043100 [Rhododendron molle]|uniref:Uncharacterized protein n=1 Tax=Rhododendron molle TaxID=49168 RepID=A0ACC0LZ64_RHOML|nr:hypothetical protein RHMOL_Rhmol10G0043100 [Rhododendron molle]
MTNTAKLKSGLFPRRQSFIVPKENLVLSGHSCQCQVTIQDACTSFAGFCAFTWDGTIWIVLRTFISISVF